MRKMGKRALAAILSMLLILTLVPEMAWADENGEIDKPEMTAELVGAADVSVTVTADKTEGLVIGDTVTLTAELAIDGMTIQDLYNTDMVLWFWGDNWSDGYAHNFTIGRDDTGKSLSATMKFNETGIFRVGYSVETESGDKIAGDTYMEFVVSDSAGPVVGEIDVERVPSLTEGFIMGMDISSAPSLFDAGVTFTDWDGNILNDLESFVQFLSDCGITHVRVRIWNNPYDEDGKTYGGGNCDVANAVRIAQACEAAGVHMLVDFHYSDFWADPGRQTAPKAWSDMDYDGKIEELQRFTYNALAIVGDTGVKIDMVQVGNETTSGIAGESDVEVMCYLFSAGSRAVRDFARSYYDDEWATKVVIHVTNPEKGNMTTWARRLDEYRVEYEVLATSYYPYWHGTLGNLMEQMDYVKNVYGKDVMVAETSYTYTLEDTDGWENTIKDEAAKGENASYPSTVQGQATAIRNVINTVSEVGGLGVFYWEPAWITVGDTTGLTGDALDARLAANAEIWEEYGCGWANKAAASYDRNVGPNGEWAGGSPIDNEAMFNPFGEALESLHVWEYVKTGSETASLTVDQVDMPEIKVDFVADLESAVRAALPDKVDVTYSKTNVGTIPEEAYWSDEDIWAIDGIGTYEVAGTVILSQECTDGTTEMDTVCVVHVQEANILTDENIYGFESADGFTVEGSGIELPSKQDVLAGSRSLHWYNKSAVTDTVTTRANIALTAGWYTLECKGMGYAGDTVTLRVLDAAGNVLAEGEPAVLSGWTLDPSEFLDSKVTFEIKENTAVYIQVEIGIQDGGWGSVDSLYLHRHETVSEEEATGDDGELSVTYTCDDCGEELGTFEQEEPEIVLESATVVFEGQIKIRYTVSIPDSVMEMDGAYASLERIMSTTETEIASLEAAGDGKYYVYYPMPIPEFGDNVTLKFLDGDGEPIKTVSTSGMDFTYNGFAYSVKTYAESMIANSTNPAMVALAQALRDYGIAAQDYFMYWSEDTDPCGVSEAISYVTLEDLEGFAAKTSGTKPTGVLGASINASFESDNSLRIKFNFESGYKASQYTYMIDGKKVKSSGGALYIRNVAAPNLGNAHTFSISDGTNTYTISNASVLSYARTSIKNGDYHRATLGKAVYLYYQAADAYFN